MIAYKFRLLATSFVVMAIGLVPVAAQSETLSEALIAVYNKNPQLLAARAQLREIDETYIQARAQGRFTVSASGQYSRTVLDGPSTGVPQNVGPVPPTATTADTRFFYAPSQGQVEVIQPLYQGGRIKALKEQAKAGIAAQREILRATENQIFLAAANAYLNVQLSEETARIRRNNVRVLSRQLSAANERFDVGQGTRTDIAQSQARLASAEAGLAQAEAELQIARAGYKRLVGRMPTDLRTAPDFVLPATVDRALALARENNPQLIASYFNEEAGKSAIDVAKAAGRPTISLNGSVAAQRGQLFGFEEAETASLTANIRIPIFSGGLNSSRVRQAKHAKTRLAFESRDREREVDEAVIRAWAQKDAAASVLLAARKQVEAAELAFEGVTLEQEVGNRTQLDVLDAEQETLNAKLSLINAGRNLNAAKYQLLATIGVFDARGINLPLDQAYDPKANFEAVRYDGLSRLVDTTIAEPVQSAARGLSNAVKDGFDAVDDVLTEPAVEETVTLIPDATRKLFEEGKTAIDKAAGAESDFHPLVNQKQSKIETEPYDDAAAKAKAIETHRID